MPQYQKMGVNLVPLEFVVTPANGGTRLASVELPVPIQETSKWWGFSKFNSCQLYYLYFRRILCPHKFLVDAGASVSVFKHRPCHPPAQSAGFQLRTTDSSAMDTFGSCQIAFQFCSYGLSGLFSLFMFPCPSLTLFFSPSSPPAGGRSWFPPFWVFHPKTNPCLFLWLWSTVYKLCMVFTVQVPWNNSSFQTQSKELWRGSIISSRFPSELD